MIDPDAGSFLELKQRVVYSLLRGAARVALRLRLPLKPLTALVQMAYFQEAREVQGLTLDAIAALFGKSLRTVSTLHHRFRGDFFAPERELAFRRAIAALVNHAPASMERLRAAFPEVAASELEAALADLVREGTLVAEDGLWRRNPAAHEFVGADWRAKIDGLNRQIEVLTEAVWHRIVVDDDATALARTYVFHASPEDLEALLEEVDALARRRAIAADGRFEATGVGQRAGLTFAAAPMPEHDVEDP